MSSTNPSSTAEGQQSLLPLGIAVMGATGSGKSSFINMASGSQLSVGMGLTSCTAEVQLSNEFTIDGRRVILIDTPGFDDTNVSDAEILEKIAAFLATSYENGTKLSGIIYIHRISDERFTGVSVRNFRMFRELCGDSTLKNVVLVTNMWGKVTQELGEARERELVDKFFKAALGNGAQLVRHHNTTQSSHDIIRRITKNHPTAFQIQRELVDENKNINNTAAGVAVNEEMNRLIGHHEAEVKALREELQHSLKNRDEETRIELEKTTNELKEQINEMRRESETMATKYNEEKQRMEEVMKPMWTVHGQAHQWMQEQAIPWVQEQAIPWVQEQALPWMGEQAHQGELTAKKLAEDMGNAMNGFAGLFRW